jgi:hypothetical protein
VQLNAIGQQITYAAQVIRAKVAPLDAGGDSNRAAGRLELAKEFSRVVMQIVVSLGVLSVSLWLLVSHASNEDTRKLASGLIGTVVGYWLR